jgi:L-fuconolactonase
VIHAGEKMTVLVIDSHQHFWDLRRFEYYWMTPQVNALRRDFLPTDLMPLLIRAGVHQTVVIQAHRSLDEARWLLQLAEAHDFIAGVVTWADLASPRLGEHLDELQLHPKFKGIRHPIEDEPDDAWIIRSEVLRGLAELEHRGIPYDLLVWPRHLEHALKVRERCPELRLVVDHLANPPIAQATLEGWWRELENIARLPHIFCKLSGMVTQANRERWTPEDLKPYVAHAVQAFGYDRLMFGSDWPVCTLAGPYHQVVDALREVLNGLAEKDASRVWGGTAAEFYRLSVISKK